MIRQEMFETAVSKMWEQKSFSTSNGKCSYISAGGRKRCAFGHLLTEEEANAADKVSINGQVSVTADRIIREMALERFFGEEDFCADLQHYLHDRLASTTYPNIFNNERIFDRKTFLGMTCLFAKKYNLDINFLDNLKEQKFAVV
jgi:hypothetical protein